jgi:hypothetical protein
MNPGSSSWRQQVCSARYCHRRHTFVVTKRGRPVARVVPLASNKPNALRGFIVATARAHDAILVTADDRIPESGLVRCVWD